MNRQTADLFLPFRRLHSFFHFYFHFLHPFLIACKLIFSSLHLCQESWFRIKKLHKKRHRTFLHGPLCGNIRIMKHLVPLLSAPLLLTSVPCSPLLPLPSPPPGARLSSWSDFDGATLTLPSATCPAGWPSEGPHKRFAAPVINIHF